MFVWVSGFGGLGFVRFHALCQDFQGFYEVKVLSEIYVRVFRWFVGLSRGGIISFGEFGFRQRSFCV